MNENTQVTIKNNDGIIYVLDTDGDLSHQQIDETIKNSVGDAKESDIMVISSRKNRWDNQTDSVSLRKDLAKQLLRTGNYTNRMGHVPN